MIRAVVLALLASASISGVASAQRPDRNMSRFQEATEERQIAAPGGGDDSVDETTTTSVSGSPENMEDALYLRERADNLGEAARAFEDEQLQQLLHSREQLVVARRTEAIRLLEEFISEEPEEAIEMPDALLRLAELKLGARPRELHRDLRRLAAGPRGEPRPSAPPGLRRSGRRSTTASSSITATSIATTWSST